MLDNVKVSQNSNIIEPEWKKLKESGEVISHNCIWDDYHFMPFYHIVNSCVCLY